MHRLTLMIGLALTVANGAGAQGLDPTIRAKQITRLTDHVYVIPDENRPLVPNVGIVVGTKATLVIDSGLGEPNGQIVYRVARNLSESNRLYVTATHTHPEHDLGAMGFPEEAIVVRSERQEVDITTGGMRLADRFATFSELTAQALEGAAVRGSDIVFADSLRLDLGGVQVRLFSVGPAHTGGDLAFYVEEDSVLFTGDVVMDQFPMPLAAGGTLAHWLHALDRFEALNPALVVPCHYAIGDLSLVLRYREFFQAVRAQVESLRSNDLTGDALIEAVAEPVTAQFSTWSDRGRIASTVRLVLRDLTE